ncbi:MAG: tRNA 2-thiocytidine biosynthesis TtcA family protein [Candidatus Enteromonas sp.]
MRYIRRVLASLRKADELFSLIESGDRIALGISGGKDSLCLLKAMALYTKFSHKDFHIVPITLDLGFPGFDPGPLKEFAASLGLRLEVEDCREVFPILQQNTPASGHIPCSICSRMKKAAINAAAKKHRCGKVAFAHHKDDALETLFMNMIHGGRVATFEPFMRLDRAGITFIRPLILAREEDLRGMAKEENLPVVPRVCPADGFTEREWTKNLLARIYEERPEAEANLSSMLANYKDFCLYFSHIERKENDGSPYSLKPVVMKDDAFALSSLAAKEKWAMVRPGADAMLLRKNGKTIGFVAFSRVLPHRYVLFDIRILKGKEEDLVPLLTRFERLLSREENPLELIALKKRYPRQMRSLGYLDAESEGKKVFRKKVFR